MTANGWFQIFFFLLVIFVSTKPWGVFMTRVFNRERTFLDPLLRPIEKVVYHLTGVAEQHEMRWTEYTTAMLLFSGVSMTLLYLIERTQKWLPFNPEKLPNPEPGLAYHNFASAAVGMVLAIVVIRGIARRETENLGNFWVDTTRCLLWVLLPMCLVGSLIFVSQGVVQNLKPYTTAELLAPHTVEVTGADGKTTAQTVTRQMIAQGPVASQEVIKEFGTNGGGFFNANSAHPF